MVKEFQTKSRFSSNCQGVLELIIRLPINRKMFFELTEVQKMETQLSALEESKEKLDNATIQSFCKDPNAVQDSLDGVIAEVLKENEECLTTLNQLEDQVEMSFLIPNSLQIDDLLYDKSHLPDWFEFVFQKEYEKQKVNFDVMAKRVYKVSGLSQAKANFEKDSQAFRLLTERYSSLTSAEKASLNIMCEAELIRTKTHAIREKFRRFCHQIVANITTFLEQSVGKSMNFSNSISSIGTGAMHQTFAHQKSPHNLPSYEEELRRMRTFQNQNTHPYQNHESRYTTGYNSRFGMGLASTPNFEEPVYQHRMATEGSNHNSGLNLRKQPSDDKFYQSFYGSGKTSNFIGSRLREGSLSGKSRVQMRMNRPQYVPRHVPQYQHPGGFSNTAYDFYH